MLFRRVGPVAEIVVVQHHGLARGPSVGHEAVDGVDVAPTVNVSAPGGSTNHIIVPLIWWPPVDSVYHMGKEFVGWLHLAEHDVSFFET